MKSKMVWQWVLILHLLVCQPLLGFAQPGAAPPTIYCKHFIYGYPLGAPSSNALIIRDLYALSLNSQTKLADWVSYYLTPHETQGTLDLERKWHNDPWLAPGQALEVKPQDDYAEAKEQQHYDRGHLAPLASFKGSRFASQVNFYSNIVPQKGDLNEGPWMRLEDKVRGLVAKCGQVWVMSGPLYEKDMARLIKTAKAHRVPSAFWTVIVTAKENKDGKLKDLKAAAFIMDQGTPRKSDLQSHLVTVQEVERRSKLNFFWLLPETEQSRLESEKPLAWVQEWLK